MKRVITAADASGKSFFESVGEGTPSFAEMWVSAPGDPLRAAPPAHAGPTQLEPLPGGTSFRVFELPDDAVVAEYLRSQSVPGVKSDGFHRTRTLDYVLILDGEVSLELDRGIVKLGPGDCVVQRGTSHAWRNKSGKPVRMAVVMVGLPEPA